MSAALAIRIERLAKRYELGANAGMFRYPSLRDSMSEGAGRLVQRLRSGGAASLFAEREMFWALRDVSFDVPRGQVVGVIGRNGAGKSTLLKVLSRITKPTAGAADIFGRVGSLLEVGTGFHPDLTGRENIFLNGAMLGMRRAEVLKNFDAIVEFSGVARFLDTPVKRYSSGMYVRLAFAVAAHLETEILFVDEVLAVGDAEFQRKCIDKMQDVVRDGRTILFVSHNMAAVQSLCQRAILLEGGRVVADDSVRAVVDRYLRSPGANTDGRIPDGLPRSGSGEARFTHVALATEEGQSTAVFYLGQPVTIEATLDVRLPITGAVVEFGISTLDGTRVATVFSTDLSIDPIPLQPGRSHVGVRIDVALLPRIYAVDLGIHHASHGMTIDMVPRAIELEVSNVPDTRSQAQFSTESRGFVRPKADWLSPVKE